MSIVSDIEIRLRADIARLQQDMNAARSTVGGAMDRIGNAVDGATKQIKQMIGALAGVAGVKAVIELSDAYDEMSARLKAATGTSAQFINTQQALIALAERQRTSLGATTDLYVKASAATADMGVSQKDLRKFTEGVSAALTINGTSAQAASGALQQLGQALGGTTIQAEEYNSILDGARPLLQAVANNIGAAGGSVASLTQLVKAGKVGSAEFFAAAVKGADDLVAAAGEIPLTFSQAMGIAKDRLMLFVGGMNQSTGVVSALSQSVVLASQTLVFLAKNLDVVVSLVTTLAAARGISWIAEFTKGLYASVTASRAAAAATLATAQANAAATASAVTLTTARVAELRAAVIAAEGQVALAITTNGLIPAQARLTVATEAHTASLLALSVAQRAASTSAAAASGIMALLGGPIGAIVTVLGLGVTAWYMWGRASTEVSRNAAGEVEESTGEILANLERQNVKLRERIALAKAGQVELAKTESPTASRAAEVLVKLNALRERSATLTGVEQIRMVELALEYKTLTQAMQGTAGLKTTLDTLTNEKKTGDWMAVYATDAEKLKTKLDEVRKSYTDGIIPPELEKRIRDSFAAKDGASKAAAAAAGKEQQAYATLVTSIKEKLAANALEFAGVSKMTDAQKMTVKLNAEIATGTNKLSAVSIKRARDLIAQVAAEDAQLLAARNIATALEERKTAQDAAYASLATEVEGNKRAVATYGMSKQAIELNTIAILEDQMARRSELEMSEDYVAQLEREIALRKENAEVLGGLEVKAAQKKAAEDNLAVQTKMWESIDSTAHDAFTSIFDSGKSAFDRLRDTLKSGLLDLLYQMTVKKWILSIGASVSGGASGLSAAGELTGVGGASGGGAGGIAGLAQTAKTAYTIATQGFSGVAAGIGGSIATLGNLFGSSAVSAFGTGMGLTGAQAAAASAAYGSAGMAGTGSALTAGAAAAPIVAAAAGIAAGVMGGRLISGEYGSNATVNVGTGIGTVAGAIFGGPFGAAIGGAIGGVIGGIANRAFGMGDKKYGETGITGTLSGTGFTGEEYAKWTQKGGWFRSDKADTDRNAVSATTSKAFVDTYAAIRQVSATLAGVIGVDTSALANRAQALDINLTGLTTDADRLAAVTKFFEGVGNTIAVELVPNLAQFQVQGEALSTTLQRVSQNYAGVDAALQLIGRTSQEAFGTVGVSSIAAREALIKMAGGLDALSSGTAYFAENFLTIDQQMAPVVESVNKSLAALGMSSVKTAAQYADAVMKLTSSGALATESGQELYLQLLALAPAFKAVTEYNEKLNGSLEERIKLQDAIDKLTLTSEQLRAKERATIGASNLALYDQLQALNDLAAARTSETDRLRAVAESTKAFAQSLNNALSSLSQGSLSTLTPLQKLADAQGRYQQTLVAAKAGDSVAQGNLAASAQAFLTASQVVNASSARYAADAARVQAELAALAAAAVGKQTEAERQLTLLTAQADGILKVNESVNLATTSIVTAIDNLRTTGYATPYSTVSTGNTPSTTPTGGPDNVALANALTAVQQELAAMRAEAAQNAAHIADTVALSSASNADTITKGTKDAAMSQVYAEQLTPVVV